MATPYSTRRYRAIAYGRWNPWTPAEPVRAHIRTLQDRGIGRPRIAQLAGVSVSTISHTLYYAGDRIHRPTGERILAVTHDPDPPGGRAVPADGTTRRLRALARLGYTTRRAAAEAGISETTASVCCAGYRASASVRTAEAVRAAYDRLWDIPAPVGAGASCAQATAVKHGWLPPASWDDDLIDLPNDELHAELGRRGALMDDAETARCHTAHYRHGDCSPLIVAGAREWGRRVGRTRSRGVAA